MATGPQLILFARYPSPGECKTRLIPALGAEGAASLHRHLAERTLDVLIKSGASVTVAFTGASESAFTDWLGEAPKYKQQAEGGLSARLLPFARSAPVIFFGSDTPDISVAHVAAAIDALETHEVVIGPALDGGYYLIGMRTPLPQLVTDMPWSTDEVLPETLRRLDAMAIEPQLLEPLSDCDRPEDLDRWPHLAAQSQS
ncbi:TIGR04282 family arsenosugar biosynthesis glycosyltransferase [Erythrobacter sp.]|nr:TIGR04282 family arsenosugar biosynthesis glycosyltransferase [Erythrobacter sp.]